MTDHKPARLEEYREPDDYDAPSAVDDTWRDDDAEYDNDDLGQASANASADAQPDVLLDVPVLKVDEIHLEVDDLSARVSLQAEVLSLLKLHVGADVRLGRVALDVKGVDAVAQLKVRLDEVAAIIGQVMTTIDNNPQILTDLTRGLGETVGEVGHGAGEALQEVGGGAGSALESVGDGAEEAVRDLGQDAGHTVSDLGQGAGHTVQDAGRDIGHTVQDAGRAVEGTMRVRRQAPAAAGSPPRDREARQARRPRPE